MRVPFRARAQAREHALAHELEILRGEEADIPRHIQELQRLIAQEEERSEAARP